MFNQHFDLPTLPLPEANPEGERRMRAYLAELLRRGKVREERREQGNREAA